MSNTKESELTGVFDTKKPCSLAIVGLFYFIDTIIIYLNKNFMCLKTIKM